MADGTVLEAGASQIVEGRGNAADCGHRPGMTLEAELADVVAHEHPRIGGTVGFVAGRAGLELDRSMLKREGSAFVGMTLQARGLIPRYAGELRGRRPTVRIVAIDAGNGFFVQAVAKRPIEGGFFSNVARGAERVRFHRQKRTLRRLMHRVASGAVDHVAVVSAEETAAMGFLAGMTGEAALIDAIGLGGLVGEDCSQLGGFRVLGACLVAGLATASLPIGAAAGFKQVVRVAKEAATDFLVADSAHLGAGVAFGQGLGGLAEEGEASCQHCDEDLEHLDKKRAAAGCCRPGGQ